MKDSLGTLEVYSTDQGYEIRVPRGQDESLSQMAMRGILGGISGGDAVFKEDEKRQVYRFGDVVVKVNLLPRLKDKLRAKNLAPEEAKGHLMFEEAGIGCTKLIAYFERRVLGLTLRNGIVEEYLSGYRELRACDSELAVPVLLEMHRLGLYHPDFKHENLMTHEESGDTRIIDLEYCRRVPPGDMGALLMQAQRYIEYNVVGGEKTVTPQALQDVHAARFANKLFDALQSQSWSRADFMTALETLLSRHRTTRERLGIVLPDGLLKEQ
ncbi:MAG: hypothetical protein GX561_11530 [Lentisphaerae bacterium]|jgi:serine/threonine protein kinase|nr:hypothetical protein [Lentisphaerota bacterium]